MLTQHRLCLSTSTNEICNSPEPCRHTSAHASLISPHRLRPVALQVLPPSLDGCDQLLPASPAAGDAVGDGLPNWLRPVTTDSSRSSRFGLGHSATAHPYLPAVQSGTHHSPSRSPSRASPGRKPASPRPPADAFGILLAALQPGDGAAPGPPPELAALLARYILALAAGAAPGVLTKYAVALRLSTQAAAAQLQQLQGAEPGSQSAGASRSADDRGAARGAAAPEPRCSTS